MSEREQLNLMLDEMPQAMLGYVIAFIQGMNVREISDDNFCDSLYKNYLNDSDIEKEKEFALEDCKKEWGID